jgi:hypothetical protein
VAVSDAAPQPLPTPEECHCDPYELIESDFIAVETSGEKAREAFADLENVEHVMSYLQELEDTLAQVQRTARFYS